jgi:hypothetical protein
VGYDTSDVTVGAPVQKLKSKLKFKFIFPVLLKLCQNFTYEETPNSCIQVVSSTIIIGQAMPSYNCGEFPGFFPKRFKTLQNSKQIQNLVPSQISNSKSFSISKLNLKGKFSPFIPSVSVEFLMNFGGRDCHLYEF